MTDEEKILLSNSVGTITTQTVKIKPAKGAASTHRLEDIRAIKYKLKRKYIYAAIFFLFGLGALYVGLFPVDGRLQPESFLVPVILLIAGIANLLGFYTIEIQTETMTVRLEDVEFNKLKEGRVFIETLENLISAKDKNLEA